MNDFAYQVDPLKRQLQLCELEILKEMKRVCERYGLRYYLSSGTLLGAVRHQGFIPWDDDIDIEMPYEDYLKFVSIAPSALGEDFFLQNRKSDENFSCAYSKIRKNNTTLLSKYDIGIPGHQGVWIDVFPQIYVGGKFDCARKRLCVRVSNFLTMTNARFEINRAWLATRSSKWMVGLVALVRRLPFKTRRRLADLILRPVFRGKKKNRITHVWNSITYVHQADTFDGDPVTLPFEDDFFPAPPHYDRYLTDAYGENYMTPPPADKRDGGHGEVIIDLENSWEKYNCVKDE